MNDIKGIIEDVEKSSLVSNKVIKKVIEIIGQEKWQDIHDEESDICTTAGELSITLRDIVYIEKENAELKADNDARKFAMAMSEKVEKQLREENSKLKDEWQEQVQKATDEGYARTLQTMQLTKAKEHIENLLYYVKQCTCERSNYAELEHDIAEAEQFLNSEVEK